MNNDKTTVMNLRTGKIAGIATYLPDKKLSNEDLESEFPDFKANKIELKIGIKERRIADHGETALDMAEKASKRLFEEYPQSRDCDFLLLCTQSPDYILPTSACILQNRLNLPKTVGALDFNLGCSGFIYGLALSKGLLAGGIAQNILLITSETYSKHLDPKDKGNRSIFGDGAAATWISASKCNQLGNFALRTDGAGADNLIIRNGGSRQSVTTGPNGECNVDNYIYMNGPEIFNFTIEAVPPLVDEVLAKNKLLLNDLDWIIFHQANKYMLEFLRDQMKIPEEKFFISLLHTGNTVSSTIPIALKELMTNCAVKDGDKVLLVGFGVGYSCGATVIII